MDSAVELDELVEHWTLLEDELGLVTGKRGATRLGFALLLKFFVRHARFPRGRAELPDAVVRFVAGQVGVEASELGMYDWAGRTVKFHRAQIRDHLGFRECGLADAEKLASWLATAAAGRERDPAIARDRLLGRCRDERIEPATAGRVDRIVRSGLRQADLEIWARIARRLSASTTQRIEDLAAAGAHDEEEDDPAESALSLVKSVPGNVSLESMVTEIRKTMPMPPPSGSPH